VTTPDYVVIGVLIGFTIKGVFRGLIVEVMSIVGLIGGLYLASRYYPLLQNWGITIGIPAAVAKIVAFLLILCIVSGLADLLGSILTKAAKKLFMGWLNRAAGAVVGFIEGSVIIVAFLVVMSLSPWKDKVPEWRKSAKSIEILMQYAEPYLKQLEIKNLDLPKTVQHV